MSRRPKIVILGMLTKIPVAGAIWQNVHYLVGLERLGYEPYYVEAHGRTPTPLMVSDDDDAFLLAAEFLDGVMSRFDLGDRWAFHAVHQDDRSYGMSSSRLRRLYQDAALIINLHGSTVPLPEHVETGRLVYLETDPVELEIELYDGRPEAIEFAAHHRAFSTWGLNYGNDDCLVPLPDGIDWLPAPPAVLLDLWPPAPGAGHAFTTVGNWRQWGDLQYRGETYSWSKHHEFLKFLDLPQRTQQAFELALGASSFTETDRALLEEHGWRVGSAAELSADLDSYRKFVAGSHAEFTVAKDQNVRLRSGWFSERSAVYLASGRPVINQDTGFGSYLPTGEGLVTFSDVDDAASAIETINSDYVRHSHAAREIAREYLDAEVVLPRLLAHYGLSRQPAHVSLPVAAGIGGRDTLVARSELGTARRHALRDRLTIARARLRSEGHAGATELGASRRERYERMIERTQALVDKALPSDASVLVVSKGDSQLLRLGARRAAHFPQSADGGYAGYHPSDSGEAIEHANALRERGAEYLLLPQTSSWWLDYYGDFFEELEQTGTLLATREDTCRIYSLTPAATQRGRRLVERMPEPDDAVTDAEDVELRIDLAHALLALDEIEEAGTTLREGLTLEPGEPRLLTALVHYADAAGDQALARQYAAEAAERIGDDLDLNLELARAAWATGRFSVAEERLSALVDRTVDDTRAANELMRFYCERLEAEGVPEQELVDRFAERAEALRNERRLSAHVLFRIADVLVQARRTSEALRFVAAGTDLSETEDAPFQDFVRRLARPAGVAVPLDDARAAAALLTTTGNAYSAAGDAFRAEACWRAAQRFVPEQAAAAFNLAARAVLDGDPTEAMRLLTPFSRVYPDEAASIVWPCVRRRPWPDVAPPHPERFDRLKPPGTAWPRITVVTPSFNQAEYVEETLLSVLNQGYPDLEYIVVDGKSTDGTVDILRRYEHRLTHLIVERDRGQSEAINKGLALATGELVLWLNSDDMLAPGALFGAAATYLATDADVVAGFCCEHDDGRFGLINLPAARQATFNVACLGEIFGRWLKGEFFYQPEVVFTRRILERVGRNLREDLHYTMDYELWLRCAAAGASLEVVPWVIGMFRKHDRQKTSGLDAAIVEQGDVRDSFVVTAPPFERRLEIHSRFSALRRLRRPRVIVSSTRADKIFSADTARELADVLGDEGIATTFTSALDVDAVRDADLVISLLHLHREHEVLRKVRDSRPQIPVIGWSWDNHHHVFANHQAIADVDVLVPGHAFAASYLRSSRSLLRDAVPLCTTQWTRAEATRFFEAHGTGERSDVLYGGFVRYAFAADRNRLVDELRDAGMEGVYLLTEEDLEPYFGLSPNDRFAQWASHKVSLCLPLRQDVSQRFFDALLTGQVPIVPRSMVDLDRIVPPRLQRELPVIRFSSWTPRAVQRGHRAALEAADAGGVEAALRRHRYGLENHMFVNRVRSLVELARTVAEA
jgi:tetratricopeptide (TPR) repeat protein